MGKKRKPNAEKIRYILVRSKAYGDHYRSVRGTYTEVFLAEGMKESGKQQSKANLMAKIIFDAVNDLAPNFKDTFFWSRLLKKIRAQQKEGKPISYQPFQKMEMRRVYRTTKHGSFYIKPQPSGPTMVLHYTLHGEPNNRAYLLSVLRIATGKTFLKAHAPETIVTQITGELQRGEIMLPFSILPATAKCLYVLKCEGLRDGQLVGTLASKGVVFLQEIG